MSTRLIAGDCREVLKTLPPDHFDMVLTSPPYWGLRDYGTAKWEGGEETCDHIELAIGMSAKNTLGHNGFLPETNSANIGRIRQFKGQCHKCGAQRVDGQIGLEPTLDVYVETIAGVARELWRVLKPSGTFWLNLGDCYASTTGVKTNHPQQSRNGRGVCGPRDLHPSAARSNVSGYLDYSGLKPKDLCGVPWRVAFRLQADGWWLRSAIVWAKPGPMPESVRDRPTSAYEHVFLLTKRPNYFYDAEAIAEPSVSDHPSGNGYKRPEQRSRGGRGQDQPWNGVGGTRNARNVWTIAATPYKGAHFAVMPPALVERCIKAGCPEKVCATCGKPWMRRVERKSEQAQANWSGAARANGCMAGGGHIGRTGQWSIDVETLGFAPSCSCAAATAPGKVLDCFAGSGTTGLVADRLGRDAMLIDLHGGYGDMAHDRIRDDAPLFAEVTREAQP